MTHQPSACPPAIHPWIFSFVILFSSCLAAQCSTSFIQYMHSPSSSHVQTISALPLQFCLLNLRCPSNVLISNLVYHDRSLPPVFLYVPPSRNCASYLLPPPYCKASLWLLLLSQITAGTHLHPFTFPLLSSLRFLWTIHFFGLLTLGIKTPLPSLPLFLATFLLIYTMPEQL